MNKKVYTTPFSRKFELETESIIAASGDGGVHIPDVGWGSSHRRRFWDKSSDFWEEDKSSPL